MIQDKPILYIMAGLPGTGKTTLSQMLAERLKITHLRIDTVEQALRELFSCKLTAEGYRLSYKIASDNLRLGNSVIADSCNPIQLTREEWAGVAACANVPCINIEIICSDKTEHRRRVETRTSSISSLRLPNWEEVSNRKYDAWDSQRIVVDTASKTPTESFNELFGEIQKAVFNG